MKFRLIVFCLGGLLWPLVCQAQNIKSAAEDLEVIFKNLRPADRKALVGEYTAVMSSEFLSGEEKLRVDSVFRCLQDLKVAVIPELQNFVLCVGHFGRRGDKENMKVWLRGMEKVLATEERKRTLVKNYLLTTVALAREQALYIGNGYKWSVGGKVRWVEGEPLKICFEDADLLCTTRKDTIRISATTGYSFPGAAEVYGHGGKVAWKNTGEEMTAELTNYRIPLKTSGYTVDSVWLHYGKKYDRPLRGRLKDNALKYARTATTPYPEFTSYDTGIQLREMYPDVHYRGGVTYKGTKFVGTGTKEHPAVLELIPNDTIAMKLYARRFTFDSLRIMAGGARMVIAMDSGEIVHPDIHFTYAVPGRTATVKRLTGQSLHIPFKDTYHCILFDTEEIEWPLDSTRMTMRMSSRSGLFKATIESLNFFNDRVYDQLQGLDEVNPLNGLLKYSLQEKTEVFSIGGYADFLKKPADQLRKQIILLSYGDFVGYDEERDEVTLKQRLFDYTKARVGKQDYDNLRFTSVPDEDRVNAVMDVRNFNLEIFGVEKFMISEARNIYVLPSDRRVVMMKNRDMAFQGLLNAGMFDMYGQNLFFSYEKYKIDLPKVDSATMYLAGRTKDVRGGKVKSLLRDIQGEIVIDRPGNKSGKQEDPAYPVLNSTHDSYVYFDDPAIQQGRYERDKFYYVVKPYSIKGIDAAENLRYAFDGTLVSNIVAPIEDTLRLMDDHVLGLTYRTPPEGIALYGKGKLKSRITLDQRGFMAAGEVTMNRSEFRSDSILMLPASMTARTKEITVNAVKDARPDAEGKDVQVEYLAGSGRLQARSTGEPFRLYEGKVKHEGILTVYEDALDASGKLALGEVTLHSRLFHLQPHRMLSDHSAVSLASVVNEDIRLNTSDVRVDIDLAAGKGKFINQVSGNPLEFISNRYSCSFKEFTWYMKEAALSIGVEDKGLLAGLRQMEDTSSLPEAAKNVFVSTDPEAEQLQFIAPAARYDLRNGNIDCQGVGHIDVANGRFYPADGKVYIQPEGELRPFRQGRLLCELSDRTKWLQNVELKIDGRYRFSGTGDYVYVRGKSDSTLLHFTGIGVDSLRLIQAKVSLDEEQALVLDEGFRFKGDLFLHSRQPELFYAGYVGLRTDTAFLKSRWMAVSHYLDRRQIRIPVEVENRDDHKQRIYNGIYLGTDKTFRPYAAFFSKRSFYNDDLLAGGKGMLEWSAALRQYVISGAGAGQYYRFGYDPETEVVASSGALNLDPGLPGVSQKTAGDISYSLKDEELKIGSMLYLLDFALLPRMEAVLVKDFTDKKLKALNIGTSGWQKMVEIYGKKSGSRNPGGEEGEQGHAMDSLKQLWVLDSVGMVWNKKTRSYVADGRIKVLSIRNKPVEKRMNIKLELVRKHSANQLFMYIYDDRLWYYFEFTDHSLYTLSSNPEYNEILKQEKADKKVVRDLSKEELYTITLCPESKIERFLGRVK